MITVQVEQHGVVLVDLQLAGPSLLIGAGPHCDIRPEVQGLQHEELHIQLLEDEQLLLEDRSGLGRLMVGNRPAHSEVFTESAAVRLGDLDIRVAIAGGDSGKSTTTARDHVTRVVALLLVGVVGFQVWQLRKPTAVDSVESSVPALFDTTTARACPEANASSAAAAAQEFLYEAEWRYERAPFAPEDAVQAAKLFGVAAECLGIAGQSEAKGEVEAKKLALEAKLSQAYHVHRVRLSRALQSKDVDQAKLEVRVLQSFLAGRDHAYRTYLDTLARRLATSK